MSQRINQSSYIHSTKKSSRLRFFRKMANLSQRELATLIGQHHSNISFWESTGRLPPSKLLPVLTKILGVSIEELLGIKQKKTIPFLRGKIFLAFEAISKLPYKKQKKILEVINALLLHDAKQKTP